MSASALLLPRSTGQTTSPENPLPHVLHTPAGLALLEMQGTINLPRRQDDSDNSSTLDQQTSIGRLVFPGYSTDESLNTWTKTVHMYVGHHQRLTGEVKKLPKAIAILRKAPDPGCDGKETEGKPDSLEIVEIVKFKLLFSQRPEPVGTGNVED